MSKIFISYRRNDSQHISDRLCDDLIKHFGTERIFRDTEDIPAGQNFPHRIKDALEESSILLIVIGKSWSEMLKTRAEQGKDDWVRVEIEDGLDRLQRGKLQIIPVLIDDTSFPDEQELPESLRSLTHINATRLRSASDYAGDLQKLIVRINSHTDIPRGIPERVLQTFKVVFGDWKFWVATILAIIPIYLTLRPPTLDSSSNEEMLPTATPAPFAATVYYGRALTLHFEGEANLTSVGLFTDKNADSPNRLDMDFQQYFPGGVVEKAVCLQYAVEGAEASSPPRACRELDLRTVTLSDPFWTDTTNDTDTMLPIQFLKDARQLGAICEPDGGPCIIVE